MNKLILKVTKQLPLTVNWFNYQVNWFVRKKVILNRINIYFFVTKFHIKRV